MMNRSLVVFFTLSAAACGSSSGDGKDAGAPSGNSTVADAYCAEVAKCCTQMHLSSNGQMCRLLLAGGSYSAEAGNACLAEIKAQSAAGTFCSNSNSSSACGSLYSGGSGSKKPGEACNQDGDCASASDGKVTCASLYNDVTRDWINKCQVQMRGKAGDSCLGTQDGDIFSSLGTTSATDIPARGYVCNTADGVECEAGACVALAAVGQSCSFASDCVRSAYCGQASRCVARVAAGATCTGVDSDECAIGSYCPAVSPRACTAQVPNFASCSSDAMCSSDSCEDSICQPNMLETIGWGLLCS